MKLITPLFRDPVGWAGWVAKTPFHILMGILLHISFIYWGFKEVADRINEHASHAISATDLMLDNFPIMFIGIVYPALYFIAMHLLLKKIHKQEKKAEQ